MTEREELHGSVTYGSVGQPGAEVLALDGDDQVIAAAPTDENGSFTLRPPPGIVLARLFARCRGPVAGIATRPVDPGAAGEVELRMDAHGAAWPLEVGLADGDRPEHEPFVRLMPLAVGDVAPETMRLVVTRVGDVQSSALDSGLMTAGVFTRQVQAGRWWFRVDVAEAWEARPLDAGEPVAWIADGARQVDGPELQPLHGGYEVSVEGPTAVRVHLARASGGGA